MRRLLGCATRSRIWILHENDRRHCQTGSGLSRPNVFACTDGNLADVLDVVFVRSFDQRFEGLLERIVVVGASQQALPAEFDKAQAAMRASQVSQLLGHGLVHDELLQHFIELCLGLHDHAFILGTFAAEMAFLFFAPHQISQMNSGHGFAADLTSDIHRLRPVKYPHEYVRIHIGYRQSALWRRPIWDDRR